MKTAIVGASGYSGEELVRLLLRHPQAELAAVTSRQYEGQTVARVFPNSAHEPRAKTLRFSEPQPELLAKMADVVFWRCRTAWRRNSPFPARSWLSSH